MVVAIVGILAMIAYPSFTEAVRKANRSDGTTALLEAVNKQERYYTEYNTYTTNIWNTGWANPALSAEGYYQLSATTCPSETTVASCVTVTATTVAGKAQAGDADCKKLSLSSTGVKSALKSDNSTDSTSICW